MSAHIHICPHCGTQISVTGLPVEKAAAECPNCHKTVILLDYGSVIKKPTIFYCLKCNKEMIYEERPPFVLCENCNSIYITSEQGNCLISPELLSKGDKGQLEYRKKRDRATELRNRWNFMSKGKKNSIYVLIVLIVCICIGTYIYSLPPAIEKSLAYADMENVWKEFRKKNPYNIQIEGLKRYDDNSYVAIISEPNEHVSEENLKAFFEDYNCEFRTDSIKIGYDGWLRDAIVSFNDLDEADIPKFSAKLSELLYGTNYKANVMDFKTIPEHIAFSSFDLNGQVTEEELRKWFLDDKEQLVNYENEEITTLPTIFSSHQKGTELYYSKESGFIVWILGTGECDKKEFRIAARKFSLDSDLIFGAIKSDNTVAIIARERCVPIYELSPMRQETLCLLASTDNNELAQSYERTSLFAGKQKGGKDFAPIYLSDELWHTEYGNILNVTDQMLKSWSENGMIDYVDFDYPKPVNWAFNSGVSTDLGVSQLTYNWNTEGVGYIVEDDSYDIYALNRTGSLPVSYIPGESEGISDKDPVYLAEQQAYDFFSNLSSPELVKVVQYAAMYQIFTNFGISVEKEARESYEDSIMVVPDQLKTAANERIKSLAKFSHEDKDKIAKFYNSKVVTEAEFQKSNKYRFGVKIGNNLRVVKHINKTDDLFQLFECGHFIQTLDSISDALSPLSSDFTLMGCLGEFIIDRNGTDLQYNTVSEKSFNIRDSILYNKLGISNVHRDNYEDCISNAIIMIQSHGFDMQQFNFIIGDITVEQSKQLYIDANKRKNRTWMKCPTIVESWQLVDSINGVGGHNLNSKVTRFKVGKNLKAGETRISEDGTIEISANDRLTRVSNQDYLRKVGRLGDNAMGQTVAIRPKSAVVGITKQRTERGFNTADHLSVKVDFKSGHTMNGKKYADFTELLNDLGNNLVDGKAQFKQIEIIGLKGAGVDVEVFLDGTVARMRKGASANIPIEKYDFSHPSITYEGDKAVVTIPIKAGNIEFASTSYVTEAGFGGSSNVKPKVKIKEGDVTFKVPKNKLSAFLDMIREYLARQKGVWNEFKIKMEMRRRGIQPADCEEKMRLKVAKVYNSNKNINYVWTIQEEIA